MSEQTAIVIDAVKAHHERGEIISHMQARVIASEWHGGCDIGIIALSHSGMIICEVVGELQSIPVRYPATDDPHALKAVEALLAYVEHYGPRPRVPGWSQLSW